MGTYGVPRQAKSSPWLLVFYRAEGKWLFFSCVFLSYQNTRAHNNENLLNTQT